MNANRNLIWDKTYPGQKCTTEPHRTNTTAHKNRAKRPKRRVK